MLTIRQESSPLVEINGGRDLWAVVFAANGEYLVSGGEEVRVRVWRVGDGRQMATMKSRGVSGCLAVSKDARWIAAGTLQGDVFVWDAKTYTKVFSHQEDDNLILGVDFSPDSSRLISASDNGTASIWDIATRERVRSLDHGLDWVKAAKYSPQGDRIVTATLSSVRVWDGNNGRLLVDIKVTVIPWGNAGLLWFNNSLFVISDSEIKQVEASTGSAVSEWSIPESNRFSCIALPKHAEFIAYSTRRTVTFWDTATHTQLGLIQHSEDIRSISVSPDDQMLAIGGEDGNITVNSLSRITVSILSLDYGAYEQLSYSDHFPRDSISWSHIHPTFLEPDIWIDKAALHSWQHNHLANVQAFRELVQVALACGEWKDALVVAASASISFLLW